MSARVERWSGTVVSGHKEDAIEVPFDPGERRALAARPLRPGRRGWPVEATIATVSHVETAIIARAKRFWLLVPPDVAASGGFVAGDAVPVRVAPSPPPGLPPRRGARFV